MDELFNAIYKFLETDYDGTETVLRVDKAMGYNLIVKLKSGADAVVSIIENCEKN